MERALTAPYSPHATGDGVCLWRRYGAATLLLPSEVVTWKAHVDALGRRLNGLYGYLIRFEPGLQPPARGFWSLTMYNRLYLPVDNPIRRFSIGNRDTLVVGDDGAVEIDVQCDPPTARANWLPAPDGEFFLELSIYWPSMDAIDEGWQPPPIERVDRRRLARCGA
jgi:hypothetical protein